MKNLTFSIDHTYEGDVLTRQHLLKSSSATILVDDSLGLDRLGLFTALSPALPFPATALVM